MASRNTRMLVYRQKASDIGKTFVVPFSPTYFGDDMVLRERQKIMDFCKQSREQEKRR